MNWKALTLALMVGGAFLTGCGKQDAPQTTEEHHEGDGHDHAAHAGHDHDAHDGHDHSGHDHASHGSLLDLDNPAVAAPDDAPVLEISCGTCNFDMEGDGCLTAVKVDGKAYFTGGVAIDAHNMGLCSAVRKARVAGELEGETFKVTAYTLLPAAE